MMSPNLAHMMMMTLTRLLAGLKGWEKTRVVFVGEEAGELSPHWI